MNKIKEKNILAKGIVALKLDAPQIAKQAKAGQFVVVIASDKGERVPLTLADWDKEQGEITLIFQEVGFSTRYLGSLNPGDSIAHLLGPLGHPTNIEKAGKVICIAGGVAIAEILPVSKAFKAAGNRVTAILGARSKDMLILKERIKEICEEVFITTDDGSYQSKGLVTDILDKYLNSIDSSNSSEIPALVYAIGPVGMMKNVAGITKKYNIRTLVSLNPIMVDATGMCGSCRVKVGDEVRFGCVDGPDFDAHKIDFDELSSRLKMFSDLEKIADEKSDS